MFEKWRGKKPQEKEESQIIENEEKARVMAEAEDPEREFLAGFKAFVDDPVEFTKAEAERVAEAKKRGAFAVSAAEDYMHLYREGVRTSDLEQLAEQAGEVAGALYDIEKGHKDDSPMQLKIWIAILRWMEKKYHRTVELAAEKAGSKISLTEDPRGFVVADTLRRVQGDPDPDVDRYEDLYRQYHDIALKREA